MVNFFRRAKWPVAALLAAGLALRLGYGLARPPAVFDIDGYAGLAESFARGWSLQDAQGRPSALREPAYPLLLGSLFKIFGRSYAAALGANCTLGVLTLWLLFALGRGLYGGRVARLALAIGAFYPPFIY
ncbi:MAG: hypothetical protein PHF00_09585, partial [Elusimicrobia bacterium]|nr:hypothetical protein [Elusimicrobiota bacterium]